MAIYDEIGPVYDLIYPETLNRVPFVLDLLKKNNAASVLELGTGTGLYLKPMTDAGFDAVGIDLSQAMLDAARAKDPALVLHQADATDFDLGRRFDAILALSSFPCILEDEAAFLRSLDCCMKHLNPGGWFLAEMPNHKVEIGELNEKQEVISSEDGSVSAVIQYHSTATHWVEDWFLFEARDGKFTNRTAQCSERLYDPDHMRSLFEARGFTLSDRWGDLLGNDFDPDSSPREVWLWRLADQ